MLNKTQSECVWEKLLLLFFSSTVMRFPPVEREWPHIGLVIELPPGIVGTSWQISLHPLPNVLITDSEFVHSAHLIILRDCGLTSQSVTNMKTSHVCAWKEITSSGEWLTKPSCNNCSFLLVDFNCALAPCLDVSVGTTTSACETCFGTTEGLNLLNTVSASLHGAPAWIIHPVHHVLNRALRTWLWKELTEWEEPEVLRVGSLLAASKEATRPATSSSLLCEMRWDVVGQTKSLPEGQPFSKRSSPFPAQHDKPPGEMWYWGFRSTANSSSNSGNISRNCFPILFTLGSSVPF